MRFVRQLLGLRKRIRRVLPGVYRARDPNGVLGLVELRQSFVLLHRYLRSVSRRLRAEPGVLPARHQIIPGMNRLDHSHRIATDQILEHHDVAGLAHG